MKKLSFRTTAFAFFLASASIIFSSCSKKLNTEFRGVPSEASSNDATSKTPNAPSTPLPQEVELPKTVLSTFGSTICNNVYDKSANGGTFCWGKNDNRFYSNDTKMKFSFTPIKMEGLNTLASKISLNDGLGCLLSGSNSIKCWGKNDAGQISQDLSITNSNIPLMIEDPVQTSPVNVYINNNRILVINSEGNVEVAGIAGGGSGYTLGLGNIAMNTLVPTPRVIPFPNNDKISSLILQGGTTYARGQNGTVYCFGSSHYGQCKSESETSNNTVTSASIWWSPIISAIPATAKDITVYNVTTCYLDEKGDFYCFGYDGNGLITNGVDTKYIVLSEDAYKISIHKHTEPTLVKDKFKVAKLATVTSDNTQPTICVVTTEGGVKCWGSNTFGLLGANITATSSLPYNSYPQPRDVVDEIGAPIKDVVNLYMTRSSACALKSDGSLWCWGNNAQNQLAIKDPTTAPIPYAVPSTEFTSGVEKVIPLANSFCALTGGKYKCWGSNDGGILGNNTTTHPNKVVEPLLLGDNVKEFNPGGDTACVLTKSNHIRCWGLNRTYLGLPDTKNVFYPYYTVPWYGGFSNITDVTTGGSHVCANLSGAVKCWGNNGKGQLGINSKTSTSIPTFVNYLPANVKMMALGAEFSCFLSNSGNVYCTGDNSQGQLGLGNFNSTIIPTVISSDYLFRSISAGINYICGVTTTSQVSCWGFNNSGQLGDGTLSRQPIPILVKGTEGATAVATAETHTCAIVGDIVKCWGDNSQGQLGNESTKSSMNPVIVKGISSKPVQLSLGKSHSCVVTNRDETYCWGSNESGQLGVDPKNTKFSTTAIFVKSTP